MRRLAFLGLCALVACGKSRVSNEQRAAHQDQTDYVRPPRVAASSFHWVVSEGGASGFIPATGNANSASFQGVGDRTGVDLVLESIPGGVAFSIDPNSVCALATPLAAQRQRVSLDLSLAGDVTLDVANCVRTIAPPALSFYQKGPGLMPAEYEILTHLDRVEALGVNIVRDEVLTLLGSRTDSPDSAALRYVNLVHGHPSAEGLAALAKRRNLKALGFRGVDSPGLPTGLAVFATLPELERIDLSYTPIPDGELGSYAQTKTLRWLNLEATTVSDASVRALAGLDALEYLNLSFTHIGDESIAALAHLPKLRWLSVVNTKITPKALDDLARLPALETLDVHEMIGLDAFRAAHPKLKINASS